jgi:PAS domain S-box-containing protein
LNVNVTGEPRLRKAVRERLAKEAVGAQDTILSDISLETRDGKPMMFLTVPVERAGAVIFEIDPARFLYPYLEAQRGARRSGESMLLRLEGNDMVFLSNRRFAANGASFGRRTLTARQIPLPSVLEAGWKVQANDYRGVPCIVVARKIADSPWYLIVKVDAAEVNAPIGRLGWQIAFVTVLIALASLVSLVLIIKDQRERVRREQDAYLYAVVNDTPALLWMAGKDGEVTFINRALAKFLGTAQRRLGTDWPSWLHAEDAPGVQAKYLECLTARRAYFDEFRLRRHNGEFRWVIDEGCPRYSTEGEFLGYTGCMLDITERRRAELQLRSVNERLQTLSSRLLVAEEEGRKRVARELHDDLSQQIAALSIAVGSLKRKLPAEQVEGRDRSDRIHQKLVQLAESVRRLSHELHPAVLQYSGLAAALREHVSEFAASNGIAASLATDGPLEDVPPAVSLCIYRITQEALRNIGKHAKASIATVALRAVGAELELEITDNGVGIEMPASGTFAGLGLVSMEERARIAGGKLTLRTKVEEGTTLHVRIPLAVTHNEVHT